MGHLQFLGVIFGHNIMMNHEIFILENTSIILQLVRSILFLLRKIEISQIDWTEFFILNIYKIFPEQNHKEKRY